MKYLKAIAVLTAFAAVALAIFVQDLVKGIIADLKNYEAR
jgi:hypothetical protein